MAFDYSKLRGRIIEKFGTIGAFSDALGATIQTVSAKLNGKSGFSQDDMIAWGELLDIPSADFGIYFFTPKVKGV